ncbi:MAG: hypothetical protein H6740_00860 [Alphaproteobacteria bacterium]|nr:hypothetical protein [Alphaproteobacteria bacterium]
MKPDRLRHLLAMEISRVVDDLQRRRELLIMVWGSQRARAPFLDTCYSRWRSLGFPELALLDTAQLDAVDAFYRELDELRLYLAHTEDMPATLRGRYDGALSRLERASELALDALQERGLELELPSWWAQEGEE